MNSNIKQKIITSTNTIAAFDRAILSLECVEALDGVISEEVINHLLRTINEAQCKAVEYRDNLK